MNKKSPIEPYLDEYGVAAEFLMNQGVPQYTIVAEALLDMRQRVIGLFADTIRLGSEFIESAAFALDGWAYATDGHILIRVRTSEPDTDYPWQAKAARSMRSYISEMDGRRDDTGESEWLPWPESPYHIGSDEWDSYVLAADRRIALPLANRIYSHLPNVEYLDDTEEYVGLHDTEPLQFRFRCGDGFVMPIEDKE